MYLTIVFIYFDAAGLGVKKFVVATGCGPLHEEIFAY